jgi:hypothetical protein
VRNKEGEWVSWSIDGRAGAKICLGPVFLGEISYPHDLGLSVCWRAWLNHEHLGFFRNELEARQRIEREISKRFDLMQPAWSRFQAGTQQNSFAVGTPATRQQSDSKIMAENA